jgi:hypothetical protein
LLKQELIAGSDGESTVAVEQWCTVDQREKGPCRVPDLRDVIDGKVSEIIACAEVGGWDRDEVLLAIEDCLAYRWPKQAGLPPKTPN